MPKLFEIAHSFRAMNTDVRIVICGLDGQQANGQKAVKRIQRLFEVAEESLSRFNPDSELSRLNASAGRPFKASPLLFEVIKASMDAASITGGVFDPTILPALIAAGYDKSFEKLAVQRNILPGSTSRTKYTWQDIRLDTSTLTIYIPSGCIIDLGGIGKGWTIDRACSGLELFHGYAVDAGGDIRVGGTQSDESPWTVGVADPFAKCHDLTVIELCHGSICTSTTTRRKWRLAGKLQHHIIDPRSGESSDSGVVSATVIAESAVRAEMIAKTAIILGPQAGMIFINSQFGVEGMLMLKYNTLLRSPGFKEKQRVA